MSTSDLNELRLVSASHRHDADVTISNAVFAELIVRASTAERRNKGILLQLSASGGRNIDLRKRVENAESALVEVKPAEVLVEGSWFAVADLPAVLGNHMRAADQYARDAKESFIRAEAAEAAVARVEALCKTTDGEWLDPEDECNNVGSILQAVRGGGA